MKRKKKPAAATAPSPCKSPIGQGWQPSAGSGVLAARLGFDVAEEADAFRDYYLARGEVAADWDAKFRNWLRIGRKYAEERAAWLESVELCLAHPEQLSEWEVVFLQKLRAFRWLSVKQMAVLERLVLRVSTPLLEEEPPIDVTPPNGWLH